MALRWSTDQYASQNQYHMSTRHTQIHNPSTSDETHVSSILHRMWPWRTEPKTQSNDFLIRTNNWHMMLVCVLLLNVGTMSSQLHGIIIVFKFLPEDRARKG